MSSLTILGGPGSGKTTYLAALVSALKDGESRFFDEPALPDDAAMLERLEDDLLDGRYPLRTPSGLASTLTLDLPVKGSAEQVTLEVSDYAGEEVERLFAQRDAGWSPAWEARANAKGILIFIRPPKWAPLPRIKPPVRLDSGLSAPGVLFDQPALDHDTGVVIDAGDDTRVPTELAAIELLQFLRFVRKLAPGERPARGAVRVAVLISAWDAVDAGWRVEGPEAFMRQQAALLEQFLWSNFHQDDVRVFALSATGGDLKNADYQARYLERGADEPGGFVAWHGEGGVQQRPDVTLPLAWALLGDRALTAPA